MVAELRLATAEMGACAELRSAPMFASAHLLALNLVHMATLEVAFGAVLAPAYAPDVNGDVGPAEVGSRSLVLREPEHPEVLWIDADVGATPDGRGKLLAVLVGVLGDINEQAVKLLGFLLGVAGFQCGSCCAIARLPRHGVAPV